MVLCGVTNLTCLSLVCINLLQGFQTCLETAVVAAHVLVQMQPRLVNRQRWEKDYPQLQP
jgi:hypothetical protein